MRKLLKYIFLEQSR